MCIIYLGERGLHADNMAQKEIIQPENLSEGEKFFSECSELAKSGKITKPDIDNLIKLLSSDYKILLERIGTIERCIESACDWRDTVERQERLYRIATLPGILARNLILTLKAESWVTICYDEEPGTRNGSISDAARLVDILVGPNTVWDGFVSFKIISKGYISKQDFDSIMSSMKMAMPYYIK